jgi:ribosomal protein S18 acetylase RimI-like enzyme
MEFKFNNEKTLDEYIKSGLAIYDEKVGFELYRSSKRLGERVGFEAVEEGKIVGGIAGKIEVFDYLHINLIYVEEEYRGKDIGTRLVKKMEEYAKQNNLNAITLSTLSTQAKCFYVKLGYEIYGQFTDKKTNITRYNFIKQF